MKRTAIAVCICILVSALHGQEIRVLSAGNKVSIRGLSVVDDNIVWVSGSRGNVGRTTDGGKSWQWLPVAGFAKKDFRDIEAFDSLHAIIMGIDTPAVILRTADGGHTWTKVFEDSTPGMFLDAMDFSESGAGAVVGDPVNGKFFIATTKDNGQSWHPLPFDKRPVADSGEGCFASSGTNIRMAGANIAGFVSGGIRSRFFVNGKAVVLPVLQGQASYGANSFAARTNGKGAEYIVVVGGDFTHDSSTEKNCVISNDGGKSWFAATTPPHGYRSCVDFITASAMISCGTSGVDVSTDSGLNWKLISKAGYHVCRKAKKGGAVYLAGNGTIAKLEWPAEKN